MALDPTVDSLLRSSAERGAARPALAFAGRELSYRDLLAASERLAERLSPLAGSGERVAVVAPNAPALVLAMHAVWGLGGVVVPLSARLREYDLRRILSDADPAALVSIDSHGGYSFTDLMAKLAPELPSLRGHLIVDEMGGVRQELRWAGEGAPALEPETAAILYTSGTTGAPKGALVTHAALVATGRGLAELLSLRPSDASALVIPISHAFGLGCLLATLSSGGCGVLVDSTFSLEPLLEAATARAATVLHGSPALFATLLKSRPEGLATVRSGLVAGAPCPSHVLERFDAAGMLILNVFGMTEIGAAAGCRHDDPAQLRYETAGRALPGYELRVSDGGELQVRGPYVTRGYHGKPELTAEAFEDGWFRTGDLASIDDRGYLRILGRAKEMVQVAGFNVFPAEVEGFLLTHPDVAQVAVVGVSHDRLGEVLEAFVVPRAGARIDATTLLRYARPRIAGYKLPYAITMVHELPLLASGKPDRAALVASRAGRPAA